MLFLQLLFWAGVSAAIALLHVGATRPRHVRPVLTVATAMMWGMSGGLMGSLMRLADLDAGRFNVLALTLCAVGACAFLLLEFAGGHEHVRRLRQG